MTSKSEADDRHSLAELVYHLPVGVFRTRPSGEILAANRALATLLGVASAEELLGRDARDFYVDLPDWEAILSRAIETGTIEGHEHRLRCDDGATLWVRQSARVVRGPEGEVQYVEGMLEDVTQLKQANVAARRSAELLQVAFHNAPIGMAVLDPSGAPIQVNEALGAMLGYDVDELLRLGWRDVIDRSDAGDAEQVLERMNRGETDGYQVERMLVHRDGHVVWCLMNVSAVYGPDGRLEMVLSQVADITEMRAVREALRTSEERFRSAFDGSPIGMVISDSSDRPLRVNAALCSILGREEGDLLGVRFEGILHLDDREDARRRVAGVLSGATSSYQVERRLQHKDGHYLRARVTVSGLRSEGGAKLLLSQIEDVTEAREAEEALRASEADARALAQNIPDLMLRFDASGVIRRYRAGRDQDPVLPPEAFMNKPIEESLPQLAEVTHHAIGEALRTGQTHRFEYDLEVGGELRHFEARFTRVDDDDVLCLVRDDTEQQRVRERLEHLVQAKDEFLAAISHELRTPLTSVVGLAEELRDHADEFTPAEARSFVDLIADQGRDMQDLVDDLLVAARADVGMVAVDRGEVDLFGEIQGVLAAFPKGTATLLPSGEGIKAYADPFRLRQIMRNLISNAERHGGPNVEIEIGADIVVQVRDDGEGVPPDEWESIFDPYFVAARGPGPASVGLGLSVSRMLARLMDGDLTYRIEDGSSIFELTLPSS